MPTAAKYPFVCLNIPGPGAAVTLAITFCHGDSKWFKHYVQQRCELPFLKWPMQFMGHSECVEILYWNKLIALVIQNNTECCIHLHNSYLPRKRQVITNVSDMLYFDFSYKFKYNNRKSITNYYQSQLLQTSYQHQHGYESSAWNVSIAMTTIS